MPQLTSSQICFSQPVQLLSHVWFFATSWTTACPSSTSRVYSDSCPLSRWCHPTISSSAAPFSCLQSFPASGSFSVSQLRWSTEALTSATVLPMNIQGWLPLELTCFISLQSKGLSRVFSSLKALLQFENINSLPFILLYGPTLTSVHDYWKNHSFHYTDFCQQSGVSAF